MATVLEKITTPVGWLIFLRDRLSVGFWTVSSDTFLWIVVYTVRIFLPNGVSGKINN